MKPLVAAILVLLFYPALAADEPPAPKVAPLFDSHETVSVTITAPLKQIMANRDEEEELQGTFVYTDVESGDDVSLDIGIRTRGRFRLREEVCEFTPLRLNFRKTKGTLLAKSDKLKLVTHCQNRSDRYEQALFKEYIAYRILNTMTDWSFRVRLLEVKYIESTTSREIEDTYAFLIESDDQLAKRIGMKVDDSEATTIDAIDPAHTNLVSLFQYLVGNTDFSPIKGVPGEPCCHNYVLMGNDSVSISVPYDFDVTGIVAPPHARPNPRFGLASVRQRLYRGRCANNSQLESNLQAYRDQQPALLELVNNQEGLNNSQRKRVARYINDFYKTVDSPRKLDKNIVKACLGK